MTYSCVLCLANDVTKKVESLYGRDLPKPTAICKECIDGMAERVKAHHHTCTFCNKK